VITPLWLPPLVAVAVASLTAPLGISGAFLLLPFQVSVLGYTAPGVSATNLVYNLVAIPAGAWRYHQEGRLFWSLTGVIVAGALPGALLGWYARVHWLPDPQVFKRFVALVLAALAIKLLLELWRPVSVQHPQGAALAVTLLPRRGGRGRFRFAGVVHEYRLLPILVASLVLNSIGVAYGVGGGSLIAPLLVGLFRLPIHAIAGATLTATLIASLFGVLAFALLTPPEGIAAQPDWALGALFGLGGLVGTYLGARLQRHLPARLLAGMLGLLLALLALRYGIAAF
jgi:uncharacterized membrane protein YfcA